MDKLGNANFTGLYIRQMKYICPPGKKIHVPAWDN